MPSMPEITPRRDLHVFYVLDTSGSMEGAPIQILNTTMQETIRAMEKVAKSNGDAQLKISVLEFASTARWMQKEGPEKVEDFTWIDLSAGGLTQMGAAIKELNSKLNRKEFLNSPTGSFLPIIIFMTDGHPTDDYEKELQEMKKNKLFCRAAKIGFAVGDHADTEMIAHLTGDSEAVIRTNNLGLFAKLLQFVSVTSSIVGSASQVSGGPISTGGSIVTEVLNDMGVSPDEVRPGFSYFDDETVILDEPEANIGGVDLMAKEEPPQVEWDEDDDW